MCVCVHVNVCEWVCVAAFSSEQNWSVSQPESKTINWQGQTETIEIIEMEMTKNKKFN